MDSHDLERRVRELERHWDRDMSPLRGRLDMLTERVDNVVSEIGGLHDPRDRNAEPLRTRMHSLEATEAGHRLVADALKGRDHKFRDRATLIFAGCAAFAAVHPWTWFG